MRILSREEAKKIDLGFIYGKGDAIAIVSEDFKERFVIEKREV